MTEFGLASRRAEILDSPFLNTLSSDLEIVYLNIVKEITAPCFKLFTDRTGNEADSESFLNENRRSMGTVAHF